MKLTLIRYFQQGLCVKGTLYVDGKPLGETREALPIGRHFRKTPALLPPGIYRCLPYANNCAAMTLKVCQKAGHDILSFGWDVLQEPLANLILLGQANKRLPPEQRRLHHQEETFAAFTALLYRAYAAGESFELEVK